MTPILSRRRKLPTPLFPWASALPNHNSSQASSPPLNSRIHRAGVAPPPATPHVLLHGLPDALDNLAVSPAARCARARRPRVDLRAQHPAAPAAHRVRRVVAAPPHVHPQRVPEQVLRVLPLVALELPRLARREHRHHPRPVLRLELLRRVHDDEPYRPPRVDRRDQPRHV